MIDFIDYIVAELRNKRLSKDNAVSLVRQFSRRSSVSAGSAALHPLLHRNTSDLGEQRFSTTLSGGEFFLADHRVRTGGGAEHEVLPGVAYLEMARAALEEALPESAEGALIELRNVVWAQPLTVDAETDVHVALFAEDDERVRFEIYSGLAGDERIHGQGEALLTVAATPPSLELGRISDAMSADELALHEVYAACARMGLLYGPSFQTITSLRRGNGQALARLRLPDGIAATAREFVLHPALLDGALQAAVGLLDSGAASMQPRLPFSLEQLRVYSACAQEMVAWLRYTGGSGAANKVVKLDIDLCDVDGRVCAELRGLSWRALISEIGLVATGRRASGMLLATPVWQARERTAAPSQFAEHHIVHFDLASEVSLAQSYGQSAAELLERVQSILRGNANGRVLLQVVVRDERLAGLSGLLRTAALEHPNFVGQLIVADASLEEAELHARLEEERPAPEPVLRLTSTSRQVVRWREVAADAAKPPLAFVDGGVYLITGGMGALGLLFARDILAQTSHARVILTGRAPLSPERQSLLDGLAGMSYRAVDLEDAAGVRVLIDSILAEHGALHGILHCAGMTADHLIPQKSAQELRAVLAPKVAGTLALDEATKEVALDFFVLFAAVAGALGNAGQADYAAANAFLDCFAVDRNRLVEAGQRHGRTRAIDWPLWQSGGMTVDDETRRRLQQTTGMQPMQSSAGLEAFHRALALPHDQLLVIEGELGQLRRMLFAEPAIAFPSEPVQASDVDSGTLPEKTEQWLRREFAGILKVAAQKIDPRAAMENYGIDSIVAMKLTNQLETTFGSLPKTLFFEYQTVRELAAHLVAQHAPRLAGLFATQVTPAPAPASEVAPAAGEGSLRRTRRRRTMAAKQTDAHEPVAIIGLSGRYPQALDIEAYWQNLRDGRDCITEVPKSRWDWREYFHEDRTRSGHHYSKWGGFIEGVDEFDPLFFNISPVEAETMDPQERLFLQHAWMAIEDAGYTRASLQIPAGDDLAAQVGVYAGVMYTEFQLLGPDAAARGKRIGVASSAASVANRVSYVLNLHGPSMTLDTMCSSSLTAIHLACQDLKQGRTSLAIAGGVNISIHPNKYLVLSEGQFISGDGHCQSFGEGGDGYIPGEGVGVVVLKRLSDAQRDGDRIYGVIRGSALTHGGKTNGYSVPNPQAQTSAIRRAMAEARVDARQVTYLEAHGTGTKLGDPIEIAALTKAFGRSTPDTGYCRIGSAKSNIGHCESAAGIAGLTKILLQLQHRQIVPSLHSARLNPHIDFEATPFVVNQTLTPWESPLVDGRALPRIAGISSFGAGGSNAHMIIEEYAEPVAIPVVMERSVVVLSARTAAQLEQKMRDLAAFVALRRTSIDLASLAWTLQVGREPMEERVAFLAHSVDDLLAKLESWLAGGENLEDVHRGQVKRNDDATLALFLDDGELQRAVGQWIAGGKLSRLTELWTKGLELDWTRLYGQARPRRMSLPLYPFARDRYWVDIGSPAHSATGAASVLHPLLHVNTSDLREQRYRSTFTGQELFLADHQVKLAGQPKKVLPGVAYLEMARAAVERALPDRPADAVLELRDVVWSQPLLVDEPAEVHIALTEEEDGRVGYEIYTVSEEQERVHCAGWARYRGESALAPIDLTTVRAQMTEAVEPDALYSACARMGLVYGPSFRTIVSLHKSADQVLAQLRTDDGGDYGLPPSLLDGALQSAVALLDVHAEVHVPRVPFALEALRILRTPGQEAFAWVRAAGGSSASDSLIRLDLDLCDAAGNVLVQFRGLSSRPAVAVAPLRAAVAAPPAETAAPETLRERTQDYLRRQLAAVLKMPSQKIDPHAALEEYGIDSVLAMKLTSQLEKVFGDLSKTLFFEYQTIHALAGYFATQHAAQVATLLRPEESNVSSPAISASGSVATAANEPVRARRSRQRRAAVAATNEPIAIIGLSGRYPGALDVQAYWRNLRDGKDCIGEVPASRWEWRRYFSEDRTQSGQHFSKWGGFIEGIDEFDPLFFNISPADAELLDPQERLFLQHAWTAIEDAGYTRATLQVPQADDLPGQVGVYAGVMYSEYQLFAGEANARGRRLPIPGSTASIANRVSYVLNLHGTSVTLDTMCSSSLTAIHFACQDLRLGRTAVGIAGGVNVSIHPNKYLVLSAGQFLSSEGRCQSFGQGGDGYIPGEGVGVVVLKRLSDAERDGDHVYGVIRGSALNHGGKTNGYTVPNPQAQAGAVHRALADAAVDARQVSYVEAHGTGTSLGDPIEIAALSRAFGRQTGDTGFCRIGSAKSNIGHCESAAGIAGLTKVLLQMQHRQIVPSLHSEQLNPNIDFDSTPFVVNQTLCDWEQPVIEGRTVSRIAGLSSFGAGGSNAHLVIEEHRPRPRAGVSMLPAAIVLSARTRDRLQQKVRELLDFLHPQVASLDLTAMAWTLQIGREAMEERLALIVGSVTELVQKLEAWLAGDRSVEDLHAGQVRRGDDALALFSNDGDLQQTVGKWLDARKLGNVLGLWVRGVEVDWARLYGSTTPPRLSMPAYPFARERYWIDTAAESGLSPLAASSVLHPLLHANTSDLSAQRYRSTFTGHEFFLADHLVRFGERTSRVLPGVAQLEMARAAIEQAMPERPGDAVIELRNVVWLQPIIVDQAKQIDLSLTPADDGTIEYEISSDGSLHGEGRAAIVSSTPERVDVAQLETRMRAGTHEAREVYAALAQMGLRYGPAFQGLITVLRGEGEALARVQLPASVAEGGSDFVLHPSLMDAALHAGVALAGDLASLAGSEPRVPFALDTLRVFAPCARSMVVWVRGSAARLDFDLCDEAGRVCVSMRGFASRVVGALREASVPANVAAHVEVRPAPVFGALYAVPVWQRAADEQAPHFSERHVIRCDNSDGIETIAARFHQSALAAFERVQSLLASKPAGEVLVQLVVRDEGEHALLSGLSGLMRTASAENPRFFGQVVLVPGGRVDEEIVRVLDEASRFRESLLRHRHGALEALQWQELDATISAPVAFRDGGVYLITGGTGGLGLLFARDILERTRDGRVILTGRAASRDLVGLDSDRASYRQLDLDDADGVRDAIAGIVTEHGRLDGILHSAGMTADAFIVRKTADDFASVLEPKVAGTFHLDQATSDWPLDFFVLFSSIAGATGNPGQSDYATANAFMDGFAAYRNELVAAGQRRGRTRSINWPLWQDGGMHLDAATLEHVKSGTGMHAMQTATGLEAFHRCLALPHAQLLVVEGNLPILRRTVFGEQVVEPQRSLPPILSAESLVEQAQLYLRGELAPVLKLAAEKIDPQAALETYGIDSILAIRLTQQLEKTFGTLSKTLFFEYQTIAALAGYLVKEHASTLRAKLGTANEVPAALSTVAAVVPPAAPVRRRQRFASNSVAAAEHGDIAIIGLAGRYPQAEDLAAFWRNLREGRDSITEVPADRWDHSLYFSSDPNQVGKTYSKWGGFLSDIDRFDPLFFNISPKEAELMDPQERLFLQTAWETVEDAGYTKEKLSGRGIGVYVGVMWGQYELYGAESLLTGNPVIPGSSYGSIANRVSYFFDLHGPSIALDTMCSSSLTAIHLACDALRRGEIEAAIAGGVNITAHPYKYLGLSQGKFAASDGRCRSFGAGGDGYVPGEGVGAVMLKPLAHALRDGDAIYALVKSSAVNHGGKTNGYSVPNPVAQGEVIAAALQRANIDPHTLGYIETHGTGTSLGDPIEIAGLARAFALDGKPDSDAKQFCPIGSVKSNIGHLESAAGIAALTKVLLQLRHDELVPSLHATPLNPHIDFAGSPFYVQTARAAWPRPASHARRAGISSFGAGGSNAHLIIEDFDSPVHGIASGSPEIFVLSARTPDALRRYAERMARFLEDADVSLANVAYTSQIGRTPMEVRLAIVASTVAELRQKLDAFVRDGDVTGVIHRSSRDDDFAAAGLVGGASGKLFLETLLAHRELEKIARVWVLGASVDWSQLHRSPQVRRISLPVYPFARERYWIPQVAPRLPISAPKTVTAERTAVPQPQQAPVRTVDLAARTEEYVKVLIGEETKLDVERIGSTVRLESFGIDSVMIQHINARLERDLGPVPKTLLYERETVRDVATWLLDSFRDALAALLSVDVAEVAVASVEYEEPAQREILAPSRAKEAGEPIAIIGMHGCYPHSPTLSEYWDNLRQGRDLVDLVPSDRWDYEAFYDPDPAAASDGRIYGKWGGFLADHDRFDPHFFKISTEEAKLVDPQERMFLESVWAAIEDAGYTRERLRSRFLRAGSANVGVFVGVTTNTYELWGPEERFHGNFVAPMSLPWSIANRVSYFFDFSGPSLPIDTACSSSLVAIHLACESLRSGECALAVAGGVNLYLHPAKYHSLCQKRLLSRDGKCHSYGAGDDGFVPGEGVGSLILKPLRQAIADGDRIHAVIRGSAYDHAGRSNGYSAPNPNAQADLVSRALAQGGIHPETIGYIEGHGTGTQLGDSIEIAALTKAFRRQTEKERYCPIGCVKANVGHSESAAGVAGLAKVILQMQHGQLAPSLHSEKPNPNIEFETSPFYLQHELTEWVPPSDHPRRAMVNSFGAGGVNACVVLEEYRAAEADAREQSGAQLFVLSARNDERLRDHADRMLAHLRSERHGDLADICHTLQSGREAMEERLAIVAADVDELVTRLSGWLRGESSESTHRGSPTARRSSKRSPRLVRGDLTLSELAVRWVSGDEVDWESLHASARPRLVALPTYPFARERYWVADSRAPERTETTVDSLHPMIACNSSTLQEVNFTSSLSDTAFYAVDHQVLQERILPGSAFLELACVAGTLAGEQRVRKIRDIVWIQPLRFRGGPETLRTVLRRTDDGVEYIVSSHDPEREPIVHSEGRLTFGPMIAETERWTPQSLKVSCTTYSSGAAFYERFRTLGLHYGPAFQPIQELWMNGSKVLAKLKIAESLRADFVQFLLHPTLIDGALQTIASLAGDTGPHMAHLPFALDELEIVRPLPQTCYAYAERADAGSQSIAKFNIRLLSESGDTLVRFRNLYVRPLALQTTDLLGGTAPAQGRVVNLAGGAAE